jgi:2-polyprenyl-3-methyl-5-hydroxy-6-metoxy-1,4-benzoquinol methylase
MQVKEKYFDNKYFQKNGQSGDRLALRFYFELVKRLIKPGQKILDFGCGEGFLINKFTQNYNTFAYDISSYCRNKVKLLSKKTVVLEEFNESLSLNLDFIISLHTLEHVPNPEVILKQFHKNLNSSGKLLFVVPNPEGLGRKIKKHKWFAYGDKTHIMMLPPVTWRELLHKSGFKIEKESSDGLWNTPYLPFLPNIIQKLIFYPSAGIQVILKKLILPGWIGEDSIFVCSKFRE